METHLTTSELSPVDTVGRVDLVEAVPRFWGKRVTCGDEPGTCAVSEEGEARGRGAPPSVPSGPDQGAGGVYAFAPNPRPVLLKRVVRYDKRTKLLHEAMSLPTRVTRGHRDWHRALPPAPGIQLPATRSERDARGRSRDQRPAQGRACPTVPPASRPHDTTRLYTCAPLTDDETRFVSAWQ